MTKLPATNDSQARIDRYLRRGARDGRSATIVPLTPDASDRRYFRVVEPGGESVVLAVHVGPIDFASLPFANVADLFARIPLPVPAILGHADEDGIVELEDLGDVTLQAHLGPEGATAHLPLYREAVAYLALLQKRGETLRGPRYLPYGLAFDVEKLTWELEFFLRHFVTGYRRASLSPDDATALATEWRTLAEDLASEARVLCHRDYHSRNLMVTPRGLAIIDFQDARMGPVAYDLASLLRDSYVDLSDRMVDTLLDHFRTLAGIDDAAAFRERFDLMAVQRNIKALGTFGFQTTMRRNPAYLPYIARTLGYVRNNLAKYSRFQALRNLLGRYVPELV
jgi:aminoglycoside/choline kinase family phosphotransferase